MKLLLCLTNDWLVSSEYKMVSRNEKVPDLVLDSVLGCQREKINLSSYRGKYLLIFFYPANFTFTSPSDIYLGDQQAGTDFQLVGVSTEHVQCLARYQQTFLSWNSKEVRLVSDPFSKIIQTLGLPEEETNIAFRALAVIDPKGRLLSIKKSYSQDGFDMEAVLGKLRELKEKCVECGGLMLEEVIRGDKTRQYCEDCQLLRI